MTPPKDKLYHFLICFTIALYSTEASLTAALAKEYGDMKAAGNHWCWWDILADSLGLLLGTAIRLISCYFIFNTFTWNWL